MLKYRHAPTLAVLALCGCGHGAASGDQVVAVVDGKELTTPSLEAALGALPAGVNGKDPAVQKAVVQQLIDEMLLSAAARKQGLDQTPQVTRELGRAERLILSDAYLRRTVGNADGPGDQAVVSYFSDHPALFADRRRYRLRRLTMSGAAGDLDQYVRLAQQSGGSIDKLNAEMAARRIAAMPSEVIVDGDSLGPALAGRVATLNLGDTFNFREGNTQTFAEILAIDTSPVSLALARPVIRQLLAQQAKQNAVQATIGRLRGLSAIEYGKVGKSIMGPKAKAAPAVAYGGPNP